MHKPIEDILVEKPQAQPRLYAYAIHDEAHAGLLKIGQTTQTVKARVAQQLRTAAITNFSIVLDVSAERDNGTRITDFEVRQRLIAKGFDNPLLEWVRCTVNDLKTAIEELRREQPLMGSGHASFPMRNEQRQAVEKTYNYYQSIWADAPDTIPEFLWNAKMRFGKTFATYQLAKRMEAKRVLVMTFKPAVEDAWQTDLRSHVDFDGWQYLSRNTKGTPEQIDPELPLVYFGSFQDLLGRDDLGNFKTKHKWLGLIEWDLVVFDEYHFGAWRDTAKELFKGEDEKTRKKAEAEEFSRDLEIFAEEREERSLVEGEFVPIETRAYLYLSGTPFKVLSEGRFIEEQIFNWTYTDEQRTKAVHSLEHPERPNPYAALPELRLLTYQMPDELVAIASQGEFNEFDLNSFFAAEGEGPEVEFIHKDEVQKWLDIIRGAYGPNSLSALKTGTKPPFPYSDTRLLPYLQHSLWTLPSIASCAAMENLLAERQNIWWSDYTVVNVSAPSVGVGIKALDPVREAIGSGFESKTITLTVGKLTTGVTVPQWSSILMLRNLEAPESYFQAAFRVQSPWVIRNPEGDDPNYEKILKPVCFVFDFAPTRALRQISDYGMGLSPENPNPEDAVEELVNFLPVLAYDGSNMTQVDAAEILDISMAGTSATLLARKWGSPLLVNVDNFTLSKLMGNTTALDAVMNIEGFRALGRDVFEAVVNKSEMVSKTRKEKAGDLSPTDKKALSAEEKEYKSKRKEIRDNLIKFATRIPAFMYLTDYRENTLSDVIRKLEPELFKTVTGLSIEDFNLLVSLGVFNAAHMNQAVFAFRRYEDASLSYTGIESHPGLRRYGLYDTVVAIEEK